MGGWGLQGGVQRGRSPRRQPMLPTRTPQTTGYEARGGAVWQSGPPPSGRETGSGEWGLGRGGCGDQRDERAVSPGCYKHFLLFFHLAGSCSCTRARATGRSTAAGGGAPARPRAGCWGARPRPGPLPGRGGARRGNKKPFSLQAAARLAAARRRGKGWGGRGAKRLRNTGGGHRPCAQWGWGAEGGGWLRLGASGPTGSVGGRLRRRLPWFVAGHQEEGLLGGSSGQSSALFHSLCRQGQK